MLDAWQTVWACVGLSLLILVLDAALAYRAGPSKTDLARQKKRDNRMANLDKRIGNDGVEQ
jgi:heme exporter protein D